MGPKEHLAYSFLYEVTLRSKGKTLSPAALDYVCYCHAFIRKAELEAKTERMPRTSAEFHLYRLSLSMRHVFRILHPYFGTGDRFDPTIIERAERALESEGRLDPETVRQYMWVMHRAIEVKSWGPSYYRITRKRPRRFEDDGKDARRRVRLRLKPKAVADWVSEEEEAPAEKIVRVREVVGLSRQAVREGEGHADYEFDQIEVEAPVHVDPRTAAVIAKRREAHLRRSLFHTPHLPNAAQLPEIAGLLHNLRAPSIDRMSVGEIERALFLLLLLQTGIDEAALRRMRLAPISDAPKEEPEDAPTPKKKVGPDPDLDAGSEGEGSAPCLDPDRLCLWHKLPPEALGRYKGVAQDFDPALARSAGLIVIVPLCGRAREIARELVRVRREQRLQDEKPFFAGSFVRPKALAAFLGDLSSGPLRLSASRVRNAFESLYVGRSGLNPLHACLISNRIPWHLSSQLFYQHVWISDLHRAYTTAFAKVERLIRDETDALGLPLPVDSHRASDLVGPVGETPTALAGKGVGSRIVPLDSAVREAFAGLADLIRSKSAPRTDSEKFELHNLLLCYAYRVLLLSTGLRPRRDPAIDEIRYGEDDALLYVEDKDSPTYNEQRVVPLPSPVSALLTQVLASQRRIECLKEFDNKSLWSWEKRRRGDAGNSSKNDPATDAKEDRLRRLTIYFVDAGGRARRLTPRRVEKALDPYPDLKQKFALPLNFGRHWLQTRLVEEGVSMDLIDYFLGHHRLGKELLSRFSVASFREAIETYRQKVQGLIDSVGIRDPLAGGHKMRPK